ncbi:hypothetical protein [Xanthomonas axonopodis]|uniref:hypothetical protein n=1 Tax=Xanthomonas axonopodis TaxID=53413 RepID=UPI0035583CB4
MKKAPPWEQSVVIALRDSQWLARPVGVSPMFPDSYLALDGNAEAKVGDAVFLNNERLFIFEVKATSHQIRDEWTRTDTKGNLSPKSAYLKLESHLAKDGVEGRFIDASLRGHFFCYWAEKQVGGSVMGSLTLEPYLRAITALSLSKKQNLMVVSTELMEGYSLGFPLSRPGEVEADFELTDAISVQHLISNYGKYLSKGTGGDYEWKELGLGEVEFKEYVDFLCQGKDEDVRVVVMSSNGTFFRYASSLLQLKSILDPSIQAAMTRELKPDTTIVKAKRGWAVTPEPVIPPPISRRQKWNFLVPFPEEVP